ncbi:hypothetical protein B0H19DRAFT_1124004, partial [Mycena capillaripes]
GRGESRKVLLPIGDNIGREIEITPMTVDEFCAKYELGDDILHRLNNDKVESDIGALITAKDLTSPEYGLKLGHVAEVKWALKLFLLSCPGIKEMELPVKGTTGGEGGHGEKQGGEGGLGKGPVPIASSNSAYPFFEGGGQGGDGGEAGAPPPAVTKKDRAIGGNVPSEFRNRDCKIFLRRPRRCRWRWFSGGWRRWYRGCKVSRGQMLTDDTGDSNWVVLLGQKGTGGPGVRIGGKGGTGEPPKFPKPLVEIEQTQRHRVNANNVRLKEGEGINPKLREFNPQLNEKLIDRLHELGFQTVGGLFEIYDVDLDKEPFETGNKESLKITLEQFLIRSE